MSKLTMGDMEEEEIAAIRYIPYDYIFWKQVDDYKKEIIRKMINRKLDNIDNIDNIVMEWMWTITPDNKIEAYLDNIKLGTFNTYKEAEKEAEIIIKGIRQAIKYDELLIKEESNL